MDNTTSLFRAEYKTRAAYLNAYRSCVKRYGFKARVGGGWKFFTFSSDYQTWRNQR